MKKGAKNGMMGLIFHSQMKCAHAIMTMMDIIRGIQVMIRIAQKEKGTANKEKKQIIMKWDKSKSSSNEAMTQALNYVLCIISEIKR